MFLSEVRSWRKNYVEKEYVCSDFAKEVVRRASEQRIRCGYVVVEFDGSDTAHAIVAFDTDFGLRYFEPQTGDEQRIIVGGVYPSALKGIPANAIVSYIRISWNDQIP